MAQINMGRVFLGGIVAGIVGNILSFLADGLILAPQWAEGMRALGKPDLSVNQIIGFNLLGFAYESSRSRSMPRFVRGMARDRELPYARDWRFGWPGSCCPTSPSWEWRGCSPPISW